MSHIVADSGILITVDHVDNYYPSPQADVPPKPRYSSSNNRGPLPHHRDRLII